MFFYQKKDVFFRGTKKKSYLCAVKTNAQVAKLVDALVSGTNDRKVLQVRVLSWAPIQSSNYQFPDSWNFFFF